MWIVREKTPRKQPSDDPNLEGQNEKNPATTLRRRKRISLEKSTLSDAISEGEKNIVEKFIMAGRWHVRVDPPFKGKEVWRYAHYVWLLGNPAFKDIPKHYVIHHLDRNELNDDISNLVLMLGFHHQAFHLKYRNIETTITINGKDISKLFYEPSTRPHVSWDKRRNTFRVYFQTKDEDTGRSRRVWVGTWNGRRIDSKEMAEMVCNKVWNESIRGKQEKSSIVLNGT
jgi:hypothetical protein